MVPPDILELAAQGVCITVATRDARLLPASADAVGLRFSQDGSRLAILIAESACGRILDDCRENGRVAVTFAIPTTYETAQVKGRFRGLRALEEADLELFASWCVKVRRELIASGTPRDTAGALCLQPTHALEIDVTDVFTQTPGPRAGQRAQ